MSFVNLIRRRAYSGAILRRHASSTAKSERLLPDDKLRALISLYHQADTFITLDTLSDRIDDAFTKQDNPLRHSTSIKELREALAFQRKQPRVSEWDREVMPNDNSNDRVERWSGLKRGREQMVKQALHGLNDQGNLPGVEVLKDAVKGDKLQKRLESDIRDLLEEKEL